MQSGLSKKIKKLGPEKSFLFRRYLASLEDEGSVYCKNKQTIAVVSKASSELNLAQPAKDDDNHSEKERAMKETLPDTILNESLRHTAREAGKGDDGNHSEKERAMSAILRNKSIQLAAWAKVNFLWISPKRSAYSGYAKAMDKLPVQYHDYFDVLFLLAGLYVTMLPIVWGTYQLSEFYDLSNHPYLDPRSMIGSIVHALPLCGAMHFVLPNMLDIPYNYRLLKLDDGDMGIPPPFKSKRGPNQPQKPEDSIKVSSPEITEEASALKKTQ
ncbi:MAG TPA: hypothetical protein QF353_03585 [Gammaproteobacteria bacterium]|nr:hypothetical protein [Gammaproteobacteria bacterium]